MTNLDHVGLIVPRLDEAARLFRALGFTLTQRAEHTRIDETGAVVPAGSVQQSVMLEDGYIELQEITDRQGRHLLSPAAAKYFGLHIVAFGVQDAEEANAAVRRNGLEVGPVMRWGRAIREPDAEGEARFAFFVAPYHAADEALLCWTQHLTPSLIRSRRLTAHANGARSLSGIVVAARDEAEAERLVARYVAGGGTRAADAPFAVSFESMRVQVTPNGAFRQPARFDSPEVVGLILRLDRPQASAERARSEGKAVFEWSGDVCVDLFRDCGITLVLETA